jgi:hypothetical protein
MSLPGVPALAYLPKSFVVSGDAAATAQRIASGETVYRLIVLGALVSMIFYVFLALKLYQLFEDVDRGQARLLVSFVMVSVALGLVDVIGVFLIMGCVGWVAMSAIFIVAPHAHRLTDLAFMLAQPGELSILAWLLVKSFTPKPTEARLAYAQ